MEKLRHRGVWKLAWAEKEPENANRGSGWSLPHPSSWPSLHPAHGGLGEQGSSLPDANLEQGCMNDFFNKGREPKFSPQARLSAQCEGSKPDRRGVPPHFLTLKS